MPKANRTLIEFRVNGVSVSVDEAPDHVADSALPAELSNLVGGQVAAVDQHRIPGGDSGAVEIGGCRGGQAEHAGNRAVGFDRALGLKLFEDRRAGEDDGLT